MYQQYEIRRAAEQAAMQIPIIAAVRRGDLESLRQLISNGADVNIAVEGGGKTPLHIACETKNVECTAELILAKANIEARTKSDFTPLHAAAQVGATTIVEMLCKEGADIDSITEQGCTPLHEAAAKGHLQTTAALLKFNANPNIKDKLYNLTAANLANCHNHNAVRDLITAQMTYQQQFIQNVNNILFTAKGVCSKQPAAYKFLDNFSKALVGIEDGDTVFTLVKSSLSAAEYKPLNEVLFETRTLLIKNMHSYNDNKRESLGSPAKLALG